MTIFDWGNVDWTLRLDMDIKNQKHYSYDYVSKYTNDKNIKDIKDANDLYCVWRLR